MRDTVSEEATQVLGRFYACLQHYAEHRPNDLCVGQFLDEEGMLARQEGIYGSSAWVLFARDATDEHVQGLRSRCVERLKGWVGNQSAAAESPAQELKRVIPKICYALEALRSAGAEQESAALKVIIKNGRKDHGWGYLVAADTPSPISTCYVLRALRLETAFTDELAGGVRYLLDKISEEPGHCARLFVANTILTVCDSLTEVHAKTRPEVKKKSIQRVLDYVRELRKQLARDPSSVPNPHIVDFSDPVGERVRYVRIPTDVVLLEGLLLAARGNLLYLRAGMGHALLRRLSESIGNEKFARDSIGHRVAASNMVYLHSVLSSIALTDSPRVRRSIAWYEEVSQFSSQFEFNVGVAIVAWVLMIAAWCAMFILSWPPGWVIGAFLGFFVKAIADVLRDVHAARKGGDW